MVDLQLLRSRVRELRGDLTQREFGDLLGFSQSYIADIERGRNRPSFEFLLAILKQFDVSLDWVFGLERSDCSGSALFLDPEDRNFVRLIDALVDQYRQAEPDYRAWMRVQLRRAFPELVDDRPED